MQSTSRVLCTMKFPQDRCNQDDSLASDVALQAEALGNKGMVASGALAATQLHDASSSASPKPYGMSIVMHVSTFSLGS